MKTLRTFLRPALAFVLALASIPAWACARPCGTTQDVSLACVRLCAHSRDLLTQGGKFASVGATACGVETRFSQPSVVIASQAPLQAPTAVFIGIADAGQIDLAQALTLPSATRGPPLPSHYVSRQHPTTNGPPSLV